MGKIKRLIKKTARSDVGQLRKDARWLNKKGKSIVRSAFAKGKKKKR